MPKKKRTRKEKLQSDMRRQTPRATVPQPQETIATTYSVSEMLTPSPKVTSPESIMKQQTIITSDYAYLNRDLLKTTLLTGTIVALELFIYFFTKTV